MSELSKVRAAIINGSFTNDDLNDIIEAVKFARTQLGRKTLWSIRVGSSVEFTSSKTGKLITGEVTKVGRKNLVIREHGVSYGNWRVPANMVKVTV